MDKMRVKVYDYLTSRFKIDSNLISLNSMIDPSDKFSTSEYTIEPTIGDTSHDYIQRVYNGDIHEHNACVKFMKSLKVILSEFDNNDECSIYMEKISLPLSVNNPLVVVYKREKEIYNKFVRGDINVPNINKLPAMNNNLTIEYAIDKDYVFQHMRKTRNVFYICVPYSSQFIANDN